MKSLRIKFANEFCFNAILEEAEKNIDTGLIDYQVLQDNLFIKKNDGEFINVSVAREERTVISRLKLSYKRSLLRVDLINSNLISFTLLEFSDSNDYDEQNPFRIIVDQAIYADLRKNNIDIDNAVNEIKKQLIVDENGKHAFVCSKNNKTTSIEMLGDKYSFTITETPQHYLHIVQMNKRSNRDRINYPIVLINGCIEIVNELTDRAILTARADEQYKNLLGSDAEFIDLWNVYNELELESIKQEAIEMGYLKYKGFRYSNGMIIFMVDGGYTRREFCKDNMYYVAVRSIDPSNPMDYNYYSATTIGTEIDFSCINSREFRIKEEMYTIKEIPEKGYLLPSIFGSEIQKRRRAQAETNILSNKCRMSGLKNIIQAGAMVGVTGRKYLPISDDLEKTIFEDKNLHFTEKQKNAIDVAINTPDIALIQGPPGTGKTTVIKAIVKRIDELWDSSAKILITSTQHDAVDNAIEEINYGGVPANRVAFRKGKDEENLLIYDWIDRMIERCETWLDNQDGNQRSKVREVFEKLLQIEETNDYAIKNSLLKECYELTSGWNLSRDLDKKYALVFSELNSKISIKNNRENPLLKLVQGQRLSKEAFLDDGIIQLKKLEQYLKFDSDVEYEIPDYWKKLRRITEDTPELSNLLDMLKKDCMLLEELCPNTILVDNNLLEKDITNLLQAIRLSIIDLGEDRKTQLNNVIWEFKQELTNSNNVENLIKAYSKINAATCQQSANPRLSASMEGFDDEYDYVIVDEAARSNPLDLLIPMSMGKKIILVGDQNQLPHMLERNVVRAVAEKTDNSNIETDLKESLFGRLNNRVSREDTKLGIKRTAMLSEQYRMHPDICNLVNIFYKGELETVCKREEKEHNLGLYDGKALVWIDMPMSDEFPPEVKKQSISRQCEVERIKRELSLILSKNSCYKIGIITFYSAQSKLLNDMVESDFPSELDRIRVGTVDAFQGKEFDVVLLSVVRSNDETELQKRVGFLDDDKRLCVAFSRAKRLLIAVGDSKTVAFDGEREYVKALHEMYKMCQD